MSSVTSPRGPLPPRVYWFRRLMVLGLATLLVVGVARLLGASPAGSAEDPTRAVGATLPPSTSAAGTPAGAPTTSPTGAGSAGPASATGATRPSPQRPARKQAPAPLPEPSGPCAAEDVRVEPEVDSAVAGSDVVVSLRLSTRRTPACTWTVSARTVVLRLTSGSDRIWSTQDCPAAVTKQDVVLRRDTPTAVSVTWPGQRSDSDCSRTMPWAQPGWYHATAAALGAEPAAAQFELRTPTPATITPAPEPRRTKAGKDRQRDREQRAAKPTQKQKQKQRR